MNVYNIDAALTFLSSFEQGVRERFSKPSHLLIEVVDRDCADVLSNYFIKQNLSYAKIISPPTIVNLNQQRMLLVNLLVEMKLDFRELLTYSNLIINLLAEMYEYNVPLTKLLDLPYKDLAFHWQKLAKILKLVARRWPKILSEYNLTPAVSEQITPDITLLTGNYRQLPRSVTIVLYGLDQKLSDEDWSQVDETHHQYRYKTLLNQMGIERKDVQNWVRSSNSSSFATEVMRPASTLSAWQQIDSELVANQVHHLNCRDELEQAKIIAEMARDKKLTVVSNNPEQLSRIMAEITPEQNYYTNLAELPLALLLRLVADFCLDPEFNVIKLLALLKSPYCFNPLVWELELSIRGQKISTLSELAGSYHSPEPWLDDIIDILQPLLWLNLTRKNSFARIFTVHLQVVEQLIAAADLWQNEENLQLYTYLQQVGEFSEVIDQIQTGDYLLLFEDLLSKQQYVPLLTTQLDFINSHQAKFYLDRPLVFADFSEQYFPKLQDENPFLSNAIKKALNLPKHKEQIQQASFEFYLMLHAPKLTLIQPHNYAGTLVGPAPWFYRLENIYKLLNRGFSNSYSNILNLDASYRIAPPMPKPALTSRPHKFSITQIEKLLRDPYSIYAEKILKLSLLPSLSNNNQHNKFGNFVHKAIANFVLAKLKNPDLSALINVGEKLLALYEEGGMQVVWRAKWRKIATALIETKLLSPEHDLYSELRLERIINVHNHKFSLMGVIDLVVVDPRNQELTIIDFKTGSVPSKREVELGIAPQLALAAFLLQNDSKFANYSKVNLSYVKLSGRAPAVEIHPIPFVTDELVAQAEQGLVELFDHFSQKDSAYLAAPDPSSAPRYNDYSHLERQSEWN